MVERQIVNLLVNGSNPLCPAKLMGKLIMSKLKWVFEDRNISDLIFADYNPRKMSKQQREQLDESLNKFGVVEPVVINADNKVIGGHQRLKALSRQGVLKVKTSVPSRQLSESEEKELNLRLNKNMGEWDTDMLVSNFDFEMLEGVGFAQDELEVDFESEMETSEEKEIKIVMQVLVECSSEEEQANLFNLLEEHGYESKIINKPAKNSRKKT